MIQVKRFYAHNELRNFSYLLYEDATGEAWVIDPYDAIPIIKYIKENSLILQGILNTHQHFDHIRGNAPLEEFFHCPVRRFQHEKKIELNATSALVAIDSPGHTMDHQVFVLEKEARPLALFSGDTLFNSGVGNCKNGGNVNLLYQTTSKLIGQLPGNTLLYPGHDYAERNLEFALTIEPENQRTQEQLKEVRAFDEDNRRVMSLEEEKQTNPFLRLNSLELRTKFKEDINSLVEREDVGRHLFHKIRSLRDQW